MRPPVPPLQLSRLGTPSAWESDSPPPDLPLTCTDSPRTAALSTSGAPCSHDSPRGGACSGSFAELCSARTVSECGAVRAKARRSSTGALPASGLVASISCRAGSYSATATAATAATTSVAGDSLPGTPRSKPLTGCEAVVEQRRAATELPDLEPNELLDRLSLWGEGGAPSPRGSCMGAMQPPIPRLAGEVPPVVVGTIGNSVAILGGVRSTQPQAPIQPPPPIRTTIDYSRQPGRRSYCGHGGTASPRGANHRVSCTGIGAGALGHACDSTPCVAPTPAPAAFTQPSAAALKAKAVTTPVRRSYLKQLMDSVLNTVTSATSGGGGTLEAAQQSPQQSEVSCSSRTTGSSRSPFTHPAQQGRGQGQGQGQAWHDMPADVTGFLRFHNGGKKAFHEQMAAEAKQTLARRYARSTEVPNAMTAEWLGMAPQTAAASLAPGSLRLGTGELSASSGLNVVTGPPEGDDIPGRCQPVSPTAATTGATTPTTPGTPRTPRKPVELLAFVPSSPATIPRAASEILASAPARSSPSATASLAASPGARRSSCCDAAASAARPGTSSPGLTPRSSLSIATSAFGSPSQSFCAKGPVTSGCESHRSLPSATFAKSPLASCSSVSSDVTAAAVRSLPSTTSAKSPLASCISESTDPMLRSHSSATAAKSPLCIEAAVPVPRSSPSFTSQSKPSLTTTVTPAKAFVTAKASPAAPLLVMSTSAATAAAAAAAITPATSRPSFSGAISAGGQGLLSPRPSKQPVPRMSTNGQSPLSPRPSNTVQPSNAVQSQPPVPAATGNAGPSAVELEHGSAMSLHMLLTALKTPKNQGEHLGTDPTRKWRFNTKGGKGGSNSSYMYVSKKAVNSKFLGGV